MTCMPARCRPCRSCDRSRRWLATQPTRPQTKQVQANPSLWAHPAILITTDEGGGYYDSGYIQAVDFFGDGTRIPLITLSPYAKKGFVDHAYCDHVSKRSRDDLPNNPLHLAHEPYRPLNGPAIGDLMGLFDFSEADDH